MKRLLSILILAGCLCGCSESGRKPYPPRILALTDYMLGRYVEGDMRLEYTYENDRDPDYGPYPFALLIEWDVQKQYLNPVFSDPVIHELVAAYTESYRSIPPLDQIDPVDTEKFIEISERNEDFQFYRVAMPGEHLYDEVALSDSFSSIHVTCDVDWDEAHPAGTPLDDILEVEFWTYTYIIARGYWDNPSEGGLDGKYLKRMDELTADDLRVLNYLPEKGSPMRRNRHPTAIRFSSLPDDPARKYRLTVTMTTTDGAVKSASITIDEFRTTEHPW